VLPDDKSGGNQLFWTLDVIDEAIGSGRKLRFCYGDYDHDKKLHARKDEQGKSRIYRASPYQMVATNGRYYLICHHDDRPGVSHFRIDRILDAELTSDPLVPLRQLSGTHEQLQLNLPRYMAESLYMYADPAEQVRFRVPRSSLNHVVDWFGSGRDLQFSNITEQNVDVTLRVNQQAMLYWSLQFSEHVEILEPVSLRQQLFQAAQSLAQRYRPCAQEVQ